MTRPRDRYRVGVDIGGTFTDFVLVDGETGRVRLHKCLTTPKDPSAGAFDLCWVSAAMGGPFRGADCRAQAGQS